MAKLEVDFDVMQNTINVYEQEINNFKDAKKRIKKALENLKASGWDSGASKTWFSLLDDEWLTNIDYQIRVLERLKDNMEIGLNEYKEIKEKQDKLDNYL